MSVTNLENIALSCIIVFIALLSFKLGQGSPVITEKIVEAKVYDKGFCVSCYKEHDWDKMYVLVNKYTDSIHNTNQTR